MFHLSTFVNPGTISSTLIQAFTVPTRPCLDHNGIGTLRLTHEGVTPGRPEHLDIIRNSIVDTISDATSIRLLHQFFDEESLHFSCIDLGLPKHTSTDTVLSMNIDLHDITHVKYTRVGLSASNACFIESSDDGHARGFWKFFDSSSGDPCGFLVMRFTIDASRDRCAAVVGRIQAPEWKQIRNPPHIRSMWFDGVRGRLCYDKWKWHTDDDEVDGTALLVGIH